MYYVGTQEFASLAEASAYAQSTGGLVTAYPVGGITDPYKIEDPYQTDGTVPDGMLSGDGSIATSSPTSSTTDSSSTADQPAPQYYITDPSYSGTRASEHGYDNGSLDSLSGSFLVDVQPATEADLRAYYDSVPLLQGQFGSFENYKNYSADWASLLNENLGTNNPWWDIPQEDYDYFQAEANLDQEALGLTDAEYGALAANQAVGSVYSYLGLDSLNYTAPDGTESTVDATEGYQLFTDEANAGNALHLYNQFKTSDAVQALNAQYGIDPEALNSGKFIGDDGGIWYAEWTGSGFITRKWKEKDSFGLGDLVKVAASVMLTAGAGAAFAAAGVASGGLANAALSNAVTQAVTTGTIDPSKMLQAAATAGITGAINEVISPYIQDMAPELTEALSTGNEAADNILSTMAMDVARQGIMTGEINLQQTITSGLFTAAGEVVDFLMGEYGTISPEEQAAWEARIQAQTDAQHQEMFNEIERQFGEGALTDALNSMDAQTAMMASQTLADMFAANNVSQDDSGNWTQVEEEVVDPTQDTTAGDTTVDEGPMAEINNPFEGDELINGVYYNEAGFPVGVHPDATPEQILEQFVNDKNAWTTAAGVSAHGLPPEAVAILAQSGDLQALSDLLVDSGLILAMDSSGGYMLISGAESTTGFHTSIDQDALLNLEVSNETFVPPPTYSDPNLAPTDASDITQEIEDLLTDVQTAPQVPAYDMTVDPTTVEADPTAYEYDPTTTDPIDPTVVDQPPVDTTGGDAGTATDIGAGITVEDVTAAVNDAINQIETGATQEEVQTAIDEAIATIDIPAGMTAEEVQQIVNEAVSGIEIPAGMTPEQVQEIVNTSMTGVATQADIDAAVQDLQTQISNLPAGATAEEVQTAIDTAIAGIEFPEGLTTEQVQSIVDTAVGGIEFPAGLSAEDVQNIVTNATEGYATSEAVNTAIDAAVGTINETIAGLNNLSTTDVGTIVNEAIGAIEFPESVTDQQMQEAINTAISNIQFPEGLSATDVADIVAASGFATPENVAEAVANAGYATPEDVATAIAAAGYSTPEDVAAAVAAAGFSTPEDVATAIANAGLASPEDVAEAIAAAGYATPEDIASAVSQAGYATPEDVASAIASAGYVNPEDLATALENSGFATADSLATAQQAIDDNMATLQQDLLETLATMGTEQETSLSDAEARLLESISGVSADVLLELATVEGGLEQAIADMDVNFNEALSEGLAATQTDLMEALEAYNTGQGEALSAAEARLLESITGGDAATLQAMSENAETFNQALADLGLDLEGVQTTLGDRIGGLETDVATGFETAATERQELMDALAALETGSAEALTDAQAALLAEITGGDAATLQALSQTEEGLQSELDALGTDLGTVQETLAGDITALEEATAEQFGEVGEQIEGVQTDLTDLFNQGLESVGGDINALAEQSLGYYSSLQDSLTAQSEGFTTELGDTEARLLESMTGIEASVLQELASVEGGLEGALGDLGTDLDSLSENVNTRIGDVESAMGSGFQGVADQFGQVQGDIAGLGAGLEGLGQGVAGIGAGLLQGLGALGGEQRAAAARASAPKWKDFYSGDIGYGNRQTYGMLDTQQQSATDPLTQLISRSLGKSGMLS